MKKGIFLLIALCCMWTSWASIQSNVTSVNNLKNWDLISSLAGQSLSIPTLAIWNSGRSVWIPDDDSTITGSFIFALQNGNIFSVTPGPQAGNQAVQLHQERTLSSVGYSGFLNRLWLASVDGIWSWNLNQAPAPGSWTPLSTITPSLYGVIQQIVPIDCDTGPMLLVCTNKGQTLWINPQTGALDRQISNVGYQINCAFSRYISISNQVTPSADYIISAWPWGLYIIYNFLNDARFPPWNIDQPYENMTSLQVYRTATKRIWVLKTFAIASNGNGKLTIHDLLTQTQVYSYDYVNNQATRMILGNEPDGTDIIIVGCNTGVIYKHLINSDGTITSPVLITTHLAAMVNAVTALAFNYLMVWDDALSEITGIPVIIAGYRDGGVKMLLANGTRWIPVISPTMIDYTIGSLAGISTLHFQTTNFDSNYEINVNNLVIGFTNGTIIMQRPPNIIEHNFLLDTPSQRYTTYQRALMQGSSGVKPKRSAMIQLRRYGFINPLLTAILFFGGLTEEDLDSTYNGEGESLLPLSKFNLQDIQIPSQVSFTFLQANIHMTDFPTLNLKDNSSPANTLALSILGYTKNSQPERSDVASLWCQYPDGSEAELPYDVLANGYTYKQKVYNWISTSIVRSL